MTRTYLRIAFLSAMIVTTAGCSGSDAAVTADAGAGAPDATTTPFATDASASRDASRSADASDAPDLADAARSADDASVPPPSGRDAGNANACAAANGICVGAASACTGAGGTVAASGAPGCIFSDGPGTCCVPPAAQPAGSTCASHGGVCAPIAGCNFVKGAFAPPSCGGVGTVCCVPETVCGAEEAVCCAPGGSATFRPACDRGAWVCTIEDTRLQPPSACP